MTPKKKPRRVVLGVGILWGNRVGMATDGEHELECVGLKSSKTGNCLLLVGANLRGKRVRLAAEILP